MILSFNQCELIQHKAHATLNSEYEYSAALTEFDKLYHPTVGSLNSPFRALQHFCLKVTVCNVFL